MYVKIIEKSFLRKPKNSNYLSVVVTSIKNYTFYLNPIGKFIAMLHKSNCRFDLFYLSDLFEKVLECCLILIFIVEGRQI